MTYKSINAFHFETNFSFDSLTSGEAFFLA
jgi:hypothetical protein